MSALADDAFGLLDDLDLERAHVAGISMGGMIAQTMAIARPARIASMTSIMSTTGARRVGWQHPKLFPSLLAPAGNARESYVRRSLRSATLMRSPGFDLDTGWSSSGVVRQMLAVLTQPDRTRDLQHLTMPVCVIHGLNDPMVHRSGGQATAAGIPGAQLVTIPGMGHDMPRALYVTIIDAITRTARRASVSH
jgi:pimeloyl-ACP methyl ester carboxylesterase